MDRAQLEQLALEKMSSMQPVQEGKPTREQLEQMAIEKMALENAPQEVSVNPNREASLGVFNRLRYAIEPLESNRRALLIQEYGEENIQQDDKGNLYVRQGDQFMPVNQEGFSAADVADFAGAIPEAAGGLVGTVTGAVGGAGVASIPAAAALGAVGGAAGSVARQGLSAALGTPQVAKPIERVSEAGLSAVTSGLFGGAGQALKVAAPSIKSGAKSAYQGIAGAFRKAPQEQAEQSLEQVLKSGADIDGTASAVVKMSDGFEELADQSGRQVVLNNAQRLETISEKYGLPKPTKAQTIGGKAILGEQRLADTPMVGTKIRKHYDEQIEAVKTKLSDVAGDFLNNESTAEEAGMLTRDLAKKAFEGKKQLAQAGYEVVETQGANAMVGKRKVANLYTKKAQELGLMDYKGDKTPFAADTGLTRDEFKSLQEVFFDGMDALKKNPSPKIRFESVNAMKRMVKNRSEELKMSNPNASRLLGQFGRELDDMAENILNGVNPRLGGVSKEANSMWRAYKNDQEFFETFFPPNMGDEKVVKKLMSDTTYINRMKDLIGDEPVKEVGKSHVNNILRSTLSKSGVGRADSAKEAVIKQKAQISAAIGEDAYQQLVDVLEYLSKSGQSLDVSRASLYDIIWNKGLPGIKEITVGLGQSFKNYAESQGKSYSRAAKDVAKEATSKFTRRASGPISTTFKRVYDAPPGAQGGIGNLLLDSGQREGAYFTRGPAGDRKEKKR